LREIEFDKPLTGLEATGNDIGAKFFRELLGDRARGEPDIRIRIRFDGFLGGCCHGLSPWFDARMGEISCVEPYRSIVDN
jgi:hypothetical protein